MVAHTIARLIPRYVRVRSPQPQRPPTPRFMRQFSDLRMPLSQAFHKFFEAGLLTPLAPRPLQQLIPLHFRLHENYLCHQTSRHLTDHYTALQHAIQDFIDKGFFNLATPSVTMNRLPAHSTHAIPPPASLHCLDYDDAEDNIHMMGWESFELDPIIFDPHFGQAIERKVALTSQRLYVVLTPNEVMYE